MFHASYNLSMLGKVINKSSLQNQQTPLDSLFMVLQGTCSTCIPQSTAHPSIEKMQKNTSKEEAETVYLLIEGHPSYKGPSQVQCGGLYMYIIIV